MVAVCDKAYTRQEIITMNEHLITKLIEQLAMSTAYDLMSEYIKSSISNYKEDISFILSVGEYILYIMYILGLDVRLTQRELAATAAYFAHKANGTTDELEDTLVG